MLNLKIKGLRISRTYIDVSGKEASWYVTGYYISEDDKILGDFMFSTTPNTLATGNFSPSKEVQDLSSKFLTAIHTNVEEFLALEYERKDSETDK